MVAVHGEPDAEDVAARDEGEVPESPGGVGEVGHDLVAERNDPPDVQRDQDDEGQRAHTQQEGGQAEVIVLAHAHGDDPAGHHEGEVPRGQRADHRRAPVGRPLLVTAGG